MNHLAHPPRTVSHRARRSTLARLRSSLVFALLVALLLAVMPSSRSRAATLPTGFQESIVFRGLTLPTAMRFAADGRVFVAEKAGIVKVYDSVTDPTPEVFADLSRNVQGYWDRGLLGLALHPQFPATPYVYVLYTHDAPIGGTAPRWGDQCASPPGPTADGCVVSGRLSRLRANGNAMVGAEQVLIEDWCQQYPSHSVGSLAFGADGALYASAGDGASFNFTDYGQGGGSNNSPIPRNPCGDPPGGVGGVQTAPTAQGGSLRSQDLRTLGDNDPVTLDGTIIRIDPDTGAALPDNPLFANPDPNAQRIISSGFRNPFRFTIRPGTNEVWAGDVGAGTWEEIVRVQAPVAAPHNFGWPCYEGENRNPGFDGANLSICETLYGQAGATLAPYFTYKHADKVVANESCATGDSAITGLAFYEGGSYPAAYNDALFFADYARQCIWVMFKGANGLPDPATRQTFVAGAIRPVDLQISPDGELYYVDHKGNTIRKIRYFSANQPPIADLESNTTAGAAPLTVNFDASGSRDPEGAALSYSWDLDGDGVFDDATTAKTTRVYSDAGSRTVRVRVVDAQGASDTAALLISTDSPPQALIDSPAITLKYAVDDTINFSGRATDQEDGNLPASAFEWSLTQHHCSSQQSCHAHAIQSFDGLRGGSFSAPDHEYPSYLELRLTVTDSGGLKASTSVELQPKTVTLSLTTQPSGVPLFLGNEEATTPFQHTVIAGSNNSISAPDTYVLGGTQYVFDAWSDNGAASHNIIAPAQATTYTARYRIATDTPPAVTKLVPASGATAVAVAGNVAATFGEAVQGISGSSFTLRNAAGALVPASVSYDAATRTATLNPNANLAANTHYTATLTGGTTAIRNTSNTPLAGGSWSFTSGPSLGLQSRTPASNAVGVAPSITLAVRFSDAVTQVDATTFTLRQGTRAIAATVTYDAATRTATLNPAADLAANTQYSASLARAITDLGGTPYGGSNWSFTTGAAQTPAAPTVTVRAPAANAYNVARNAAIVASFGEAVQGVSSNTFTLKNAAGALVPATVSYDAATRVATLNPSAALLPDTRYTVTLTGGVGAIRNSANVALASTGWSFTTGPAPTVVSRTPTANATGIARGATITATFSEAVSGVSGSSVVLTQGSTAIAATVRYDAATRVATLVPSAPLAATTQYTVRLSSAIKDGGGNGLVPANWSFTTGP